MKPMNDYMEAAEAHVLHTYNRFPIVLEKATAYTFMIRMGKNIWILLRESPFLDWDTIILVMTRL